MSSQAIREISEEYIAKWQKTVDIMARLCDVPAGLIMRVHPEEIEVLVASRTGGNPYESREKASLGTGLYCETVMATRKELKVTNALTDPDWMHNPDIKLGMIAYLGVPLIWPDGEVFGTICILDRKERDFPDLYLSLMLQLKELVETDFKLIDKNAAMADEIERRKNAEAQLLNTNKQLEKRIDELDAFNYTVSHDLRSPLNHIVAYADMLLISREEDLDEEIVESIEKIKDECYKGADMMAALYKLANLAQIELVLQQINLSKIADDVARELSESDPERKVIFRIQPDIEVRGDYGMMLDLMENLLGNAWKYTSQNHEAVIEFFSTIDHDGRNSYCVKDNGVGFDMRQAEKIFMPFRRLHAKFFDGDGIGLATAKRIVKCHDGDIRAESEPGKGALFIFTLGTNLSD